MKQIKVKFQIGMHANKGINKGIMAENRTEVEEFIVDRMEEFVLEE